MEEVDCCAVLGCGGAAGEDGLRAPARGLRGYLGWALWVTVREGNGEWGMGNRVPSAIFMLAAIHTGRSNWPKSIPMGGGYSDVSS